MRVLLSLWAIGMTVVVIMSVNAGRQARAALCVYKGDLEGRVQASELFARQHPNGISGIPVSAIRASIARDTATVKSLDLLNCH